eukprot:COSAG01_NODE_10514_length_2147_cov_1.992676_4_plen_105_part_01
MIQGQMEPLYSSIVWHAIREGFYHCCSSRVLKGQLEALLTYSPIAWHAIREGFYHCCGSRMLKCQLEALLAVLLHNLAIRRVQQPHCLLRGLVSQSQMQSRISVL